MTNLSITIGLLLWLIPIAFNIYVDRNGAKRNYLMVNVLRGMAMIAHGIYFDPSDITEHWPVILFQFTSYWLVFEIGLNIVHKRIQQFGFWKGLLYYDQSEGDSGWIDRLFKWTGPTFHAICKVMALIVCILSIICIYWTL